MKRILGLAAVAVLAAACSSSATPAPATQAGGNATPAPAATKPYISIVSKGFQHQFWQAVKKGAEDENRLPIMADFRGSSRLELPWVIATSSPSTPTRVVALTTCSPRLNQAVCVWGSPAIVTTPLVLNQTNTQGVNLSESLSSTGKFKLWLAAICTSWVFCSCVSLNKSPSPK